MEESKKADQGTLTAKEEADLAARTWSKLEGWSADMYAALAKKGYVQFQFEVIQEIKPDATQGSLFNIEEEGKDIKKNCKGL